MKINQLIFLALLFFLFVCQNASAAEPSIARLGINFHLVPHFNNAEWTWTPSIRLKINGPITSSDTLWVEYAFPNGKPFLKVRCEDIYAIREDENIVIGNCGYRQEDEKATNQTGLFGFQ